jgi:hypothetical protein
MNPRKLGKARRSKGIQRSLLWEFENYIRERLRAAGIIE